MNKSLGLAGAIGLFASMAWAQTVIVPAGVVLENASSSGNAGTPGPYIQTTPARWWDGSGITNSPALIEDGDAIPVTWPQHLYGNDYNRMARIRDTAETFGGSSGSAELTFNLGGVAEIEGIVLWNAGEGSAAGTESDRGVQTAAISWSTNGVDFISTGETLTFAKGPQGEALIDADPQYLTTSIPNATHIRMACANFTGHTILGFTEVRMIGTRVADINYVANSPVDWNSTLAWSDGNPATPLRSYYVNNNVVLNTPAVTETFAGSSLTLEPAQRMELMVSGSDVITVGDLTLNAAELAAGVVDANEAKIDGSINVSSNSLFSGATRDLRVLSQVRGGASIELSAPSHTIYVDNTNNTVNGTWLITDGTAEFFDGRAVGSASITVSNGTLTILGDWDGLALGDSLTVADSATALVELGANTWKVDALTVGSSNVLVGFTYDVAELNAIGSAVFTGTGTIQVGVPFVAPLPPQLLHHWEFDEGTGTVAVDSAGTNNGVISAATWASDSTRSSYLSFNGTDSSVNPSVVNATPTAENGETWACWVLTAAGNNSDIILGNRGDTSADFGKIIPRPSTGGRLSYRNDDLVSYDFNTGNATISQDTWQHVAFVRDGSNATFYVDGVLVNDTPHILPIDNASALPFFIGGEPGLGATEHFAGGIDDVVIYNYALTASNVVDVMNGIYDFGTVDLSSVITDYSFNPAGTSSLSFTGGAKSAYVIKSANSLTVGGFSTVTPSAVTTGSQSGDVITTDVTGTASAEFTETAPAQFYKVESAP